MWADLQEEYGDRIEFFEVDRDTDEGRQFVLDHGVTLGQPGFIVYNAAGEVTYADLGPFSERGVRELVLSIVPE